MRVFFSFLLCLFLPLLLCSQSIVINEFSSNNEDGIEDRDGDNSDWIEIYNPGENAVNLLGFTLSDNEDELDKWSFPDINLNAKDFLLVFASGKETINQNELHTNFKIKSSGERLILADDLGVIMDQIPSISLSEDVSYGRFPNGSAAFFFFDLPTPNASNQQSTQIISSHQSGFYTQPFLLELQSPSSQEVIHYTVDGSDPTSESPVYESPILIDFASKINEGVSYVPTTPLDLMQYYTWQPPMDSVYKIKVIKYLNFENGEPVGSIQAKTFLVDPQAFDRYSFPIVSLILDQDHLVGFENGIYVPGKDFESFGWDNGEPIGNYTNRGAETERPLHLHYLDPDGQPGLDLAAGLRIHGSYTRRYPQKSLKIYFRQEYGKNKIEYPLFGEDSIDEFKRLSLKSSDLLRTLFRDYFLQKNQEGTQIDGQKSAFVIVFINGEYWGLFTLQERQDRFYAKFNHDVEEDDVIITTACGLNDEELSEPLHQDLMDFVRETDWSTRESFNELDQVIDVDNFIDYMILQLFIASTDWPGNNYKMWRSVEQGSKWRWLLFDLDNTFGIGSAKSDFNSILHTTQVNSTHWSNLDCSTLLFRTVITNQDFQNRFLERFAERLNTNFSTENLLTQIEEIRWQLLPEIHEHIDRWRYPTNIESWENEIEKLRKFAEKRPCLIRSMILDFFKLAESDFQFNDNCSFDSKDALLAASIKIFPNPTTGNVLLEFDPTKHQLNGPMEVYLTDGRLIKQIPFSVLAIDQISFDLSDLPNGIYILRFPTLRGQLSRKLTILK